MPDWTKWLTEEERGNVLLEALADARLGVAEKKSKLIRQVEDADRAIARLKTDWEAVCAIADERKMMCWEAIYKARALEAEVARLTEERGEIEERVASRLLGSLEELSIGVGMQAMFIAVLDGKEYAVEPDEVRGLMRAIEDKFRADRSWSLLDLSRSEARRVQAERDQQREDIRRLVAALGSFTGVAHEPFSLHALLAEMKERYDA